MNKNISVNKLSKMPSDWRGLSSNEVHGTLQANVQYTKTETQVLKSSTMIGLSPVWRDVDDFILPKLSPSFGVTEYKGMKYMFRRENLFVKKSKL